MFHYIFNYNYSNSWQLLIIFVPLETGMNTLPSRHKQYHFNLIKSPLYLVKLKIARNDRLLTAVGSVEPIVPNFRRKSFKVRFFPCQVESSDRKYFIFSWVFRSPTSIFTQKYRDIPVSRYFCVVLLSLGIPHITTVQPLVVGW